MICCARCGEACDCEERQIDVLYVSPERFRGSPQRGVPTVEPWSTFAAYLSRPLTGTAKDVAGAYSPALYADNIRRKAAVRRVWALVIDIDVDGNVDRVADAVRLNSAIIHSTFSSTEEAPRCRLILELSEPVDAATYEALHRVVRARIRREGIVADEAAKDASRLSYSPVVRDGTPFHFRAVHGVRLDPHKVLTSNAPPPKPRVARRAQAHRSDKYAQAALRKAADAVAGAEPGRRHDTLNREAFAVARLDLPRADIVRALLPAAIESMGQGDRRDAERTIRDALRARRGA